MNMDIRPAEYLDQDLQEMSRCGFQGVWAAEKAHVLPFACWLKSQQGQWVSLGALGGPMC